MAKEKNTSRKPDTASQAPERVSRSRRFVAFWRDDRTKFIIGLLFVLVAAWLGLAFISFFVTGKADQALLENLSFATLTQVGNRISNWMGTFGALAAEYMVNRWMGISVFLYVGLMFRFGLRLMKNESIRPLWVAFVHCALWSVWLSLAVGFFFIRGYEDTYLYLGGVHGYELSQLLTANMGWIGTLLLIVAAFIILSIFVSRSTIDRVRRVMDFWPRYRAALARRRAEAAAREAERAAEREAQARAEAAAAAAAGVEAETARAADGGEAAVPASAPVEPDPVPASDPVADTTGRATDAGGTADIEADTVVDDPADFLPPVADDPASDAVIPAADEERPSAADVVRPADDPTFQVSTHQTETVDQPLEPLEDYDPTAELSHYRFPTFDLLKKYDGNEIPIDMDEQNANKEKIKTTLHNYGVEIRSISATVGPTITLFEIVPEDGTRISKIRNLQDEIAMSIAASTGIRIIAPIPGKTAIGIEVPNHDPQIVSMHSVITSRAFQESKAELPVALGKTITNEVFTFDLVKMPHLLVAGATGQGKSVGLNAILTSLLYKKHPSQLKFVLVDPKQVEFSIYSRIEKHYLAKLPDEEEPIITDVSKVVATLNSVVIEMEDRYALLKDAGLRNIKEYNAKFIHRELNPAKGVHSPSGSNDTVHHHYLPYIVVVVDEYGDLIMTAGKEIELPIARIAQKARAVGIHMIIATQRPSAKIITGIIKANFPARMAFRVGQSIDSSIILDQPGAQHLIGRGDLLFSSGNSLTRVQCAFVDTPEVDRINRYIAGQQSYPTAFVLPEPPAQENEDGSGNGGEVDLNHLDPLFAEAAEIVVANAQGSTSMIQRKFSIGYNRAGRIMDQLEAAGIVGPYMGSKARAVLVDSETELQQILQDLKNR